MVKPPPVVIVDSDPVRRNSMARLLYENSYHAEPYESVDELRAFWPDAGIVLLYDDGAALRAMFEVMLEHGFWLPAMVYAESPEPSRIVDVILMGAMDYLEWPTMPGQLAERLRVLASRKKSFAELRERASRAQRLVDALSQREREVLFGLAKGASNKMIARELQISPRTIEIHRSNMMLKLGVSHLGEAVSIALYSGFSGATPDEEIVNPFAAEQ